MSQCLSFLVWFLNLLELSTQRADNSLSLRYYIFNNLLWYTGKANLSRYREACVEVISVLSSFDNCVVERASVDEAYIDLTNKVQSMMSQETALTVDHLQNTYVVGTDDG